MLKLIQEFHYYMMEGKLLTIDFIERYVDFIMKIYNASAYVNSVKVEGLDCEFEACYLFRKREIALSFENIVKPLEKSWNTQFDFNDKSHIRKLNLKLLYALSHECIHAVQNKIINTYEARNEMSRILIDSYYVCVMQHDLYNKIYKYMPIEINAEVLGKIIANNFLNVLFDKDTAYKNNCLIIDEILKDYYTENEEIIVPAEKFYKSIGENKRYEEILDTCDLTNFQKFALGFPTDSKYFSKVSSYDKKTIDSMDTKRYFKS